MWSSQLHNKRRFIVFDWMSCVWVFLLEPPIPSHCCRQKSLCVSVASVREQMAVYSYKVHYQSLCWITSFSSLQFKDLLSPTVEFVHLYLNQGIASFVSFTSICTTVRKFIKVDFCNYYTSLLKSKSALVKKWPGQIQWKVKHHGLCLNTCSVKVWHTICFGSKFVLCKG